MDDVIELEEMGSRKKQRTLGPMDKFATNINPESRPLPTRQQNINDAIWKEKLHKVQQYIARWVYASGVPFNTIANDEFKLMAEAIGQFGPEVTPPSQHQLREPLLKEEVDRLHGLLKPQEEEWKKNGCTVMTNACSDEAHIGGYIFEYVKGCIEEIGEENVVQVVTDNAANNMAAAKMMKEIKPSLFWTSCVTHSINLMLESISKLTRFKGTIQMAKEFTIFIYAHHKTLALMRTFTNRTDIVRPGCVTRFASSFLTLQSLLDKRDQLSAMFSSGEWRNCKWSKHSKGMKAFNTVMSVKFWNGMIMCLKVFGPLVKLLRLVDGDKKLTIGFLHGELIEAKNQISDGLKHGKKM
ncbi:PREDICTED: uncharacterized protein LOC104772763 [Camelina sativa]|uniref:Uncharacterized protein LOC104772763 n=1 Tax=Camelina sativa TaxID=90675 RepID=A0ABM1REP1_CAMSA|nr:PREDICTED: uncharacterized protein LOC104772763 [Camelina sativa]